MLSKGERFDDRVVVPQFVFDDIQSCALGCYRPSYVDGSENFPNCFALADASAKTVACE